LSVITDSLFADANAEQSSAGFNLEDGGKEIRFFKKIGSRSVEIHENTEIPIDASTSSLAANENLGI
jgi:hypothetical protein